MESEVRLSLVCLSHRGWKFFTAVILYSFVASLIVLVILNSTDTIRVLEFGKMIPFNLHSLTDNRSQSSLIPSQTDHISETEAPETDFMFIRNASTKNERPNKETQYRGRNRGSSMNNEGHGHNRTTLSVHEVEASEIYSVRSHYKSMIDFQPLDFHCNTCAIVSSSGQLLEKRAGREIDSHSCVLRMNIAPTKGFEQDVGFKTTVRIICFISTLGLKIHAQEFLRGEQLADRILFWGLNSRKHRESLGRVRVLSFGYPDVEFFSQDVSGEAEAEHLFERETGKSRERTNSWLSTGWFTMMLAIDMCSEIHVYGMVPEDYCGKYGYRHVKYHYWQNSWDPSECGYYKANENTKKGGHRFLTEKAIFQRWAQKYNITFHYPGWNLQKIRQTSERPINTPFMRRYSTEEGVRAR